MLKNVLTRSFSVKNPGQRNNIILLFMGNQIISRQLFISQKIMAL